MVDTIGFAQYKWQMDSLVSRIETQGDEGFEENEVFNSNGNDVKTAISPHDDYAYVGDMYPQLFSKIEAKTIFLFGVAHKARKFNLENRIIFGNYNCWLSPQGKVKVSEARNEIFEILPKDCFLVHDSMMLTEHSLEAIVPWLEQYNEEVEIVPVLIPYMDFNNLKRISKQFAETLSKLIKKKAWVWGKDFSFVISSDAVHYGDQDWGGKNFAKFGADSAGYLKAINYEHRIMDSCLVGEISFSKIEGFVNYTVTETDFKEYKWTWCGRYSIPFGLLVSMHLNDLLDDKNLEGSLVEYSTSIDNQGFEVESLQMGVTAPANIRHWVGYASIIYF